MAPTEPGSTDGLTRNDACVVVPCHNEARRFDAAAFEGLAAAVGGVIVVDDGSTDDTAAVLRDVAEANERITVITLATNAGKGEAVRAGMNHAIGLGYRLTGFLDADLATPADEMLRLIDVALAQPRRSAVLGSRVALLGHSIDRRATRHYTGRVYATCASVALGLPIYDTQCGAKVFRVRTPLQLALADPFANRWAFDVELLGRLLAHPDHAADPVLEVPLRVWRDIDGSGVGFLDGLRATWSLTTIRRAVRSHRAKYRT